MFYCVAETFVLGQDVTARPTGGGQEVDAPLPDDQMVPSKRDPEKAAQERRDPRGLAVGAPVYGVAFSPDGRLLATAGKNGARLWAIASGEQAVRLVEAGILPPKEGWFWSERYYHDPVFSRDGSLLAVAEYLPWEEGKDGARGRYHVWDVASGKLRTRRDFQDPLTRLAFSPDVAELAVGDTGGAFGLCKIAGTTIWHQLAESRTAWPTADLAFSPNGRLLAVGDDPEEGRAYFGAGYHMPVQGADGTIWLIDTTTTKTLHEICVESSQGLHRLAFAPDGKTLYAAYEDGHLRAWDVSSGNLVTSYRVQSQPWSFTPIAFSCDGKWLAVHERDDGPVAIWDLAAGRRVTAIDASTAPTDDLALSRAASLLAVADPDDEQGSVSLWKIVERAP